jgi:hypothetical protein
MRDILAANARHHLKVLWDAYDRQCILARVDGVYELHLRFQGRTTSLQTCADEGDAHIKAASWLTAVKAMHNE